MTKRQPTRQVFLCMAAVLCMTAAAPSAVAADEYPSRPIHLVVPFAPGGNTDIVGRIYAQALSQELKQSVVVENKVGAGQLVGTEEVARAKPDGYTLLVSTISFAMIPGTYKTLRYDPKRDFATVVLFSSSPAILLANPSVPANTIPELVDYARKNPNAAYGSAGIGSAMHLFAENFRSQTGIQATHVPYRGEGPALIDLLAGRTTFHFGGIASSSQYIKSGQLKAIALPAAKRSPLLPDVPTSAEAGLPGFYTENWSAILAPAGTSPAIVAKLNAAVNRIGANPEIIAKLLPLGFQPITDSTPESTARHIATEIDTWTAIIKKAGVPPQ